MTRDIFRRQNSFRKSLVPCDAPGGMKDYAEFVKEGNFSPMAVLDPELGIKKEVFAKDRTKHRMQDELEENEKAVYTLEKAHNNVTDLLSRIEEITNATNLDFKAQYTDPFEKRRKGRRKKYVEGENISEMIASRQEMTNTNSANSSRSSGYVSQTDMLDVPEDEILNESLSEDPMCFIGDSLLDLMTEKKTKFQSSFSSGEAAIKIFIDRTNPHNKTAHPSLPNVLKEMNELQVKIGNTVLEHCNHSTSTVLVSKLKLQEELTSLQMERRKNTSRRDKLVNKAKILAMKATKQKIKVNMFLIDFSCSLILGRQNVYLLYAKHL